MSDPFSLVPFAMAGGGGRVDDWECQQLVAAGVTLLQRSPPLVRALTGRRSALLLPTGPSFITALAASDGRGAVLLNTRTAAPEIAWQLRDAQVGAVFTIKTFAPHLPPGMPFVLLDEAPRLARVMIAGRAHEIDLGSHRGLALEGSRDADGLEEECVVVYASAMAGRVHGARLTHRALIATARATIAAMELTPLDHSLALLPYSQLFGLTTSAVAPLLAGGRVTTMPRFNARQALDIIEQQGVTRLVGVPAVFALLVHAIELRDAPLRGHQLRTCLCDGGPLSVALQDRFASHTGVELRQA